LILTEVLFTLLLVSGTLLVVDYVERPRVPVLFASGVVFGLATLTRSSLLFYPLFLAVAVFVAWRVESFRRIGTVLLFTAAFALTLAPWMARNTRLNGRLSFVDSLSGYTAVKFSPLRNLVMERDEDAAYLTPTPAPAGSEARLGRGTDRSADRRARRVERAVKGVGREAMRFWRIDREVAGAAARGWLGPMSRSAVIAITVVIAAYYVALMLAAVLGLVLHPPGARMALAVVLSAVLVLVAVHAFSVGHSRYHIPLMPLAAVFAARFWVARREPVTLRRRAGAAVAGLVLLICWGVVFVRSDLREMRNHLGRDAGKLQE
jgi:4-amino-4-deoxy-L-arabinose transferase-like glycosyltransferase